MSESFDHVTQSRISASLDSIRSFVEGADSAAADSSRSNLAGFLNAIAGEASYIMQLIYPQPDSEPTDEQVDIGELKEVGLYGGKDK